MKSLCEKFSQSVREIAAKGPSGILIVHPEAIIKMFEIIDATSRAAGQMDLLERLLAKGGTMTEALDEVRRISAEALANAQRDAGVS